MESMKQPWTGASSLSLQASQALDWPPGPCSFSYHAPRKTYCEFSLCFVSVLQHSWDWATSVVESPCTKSSWSPVRGKHWTFFCVILISTAAHLTAAKFWVWLLQCSRSISFVHELLMFLCFNSTCFSLSTKFGIQFDIYFDHPFIFKSLLL